MGKLLKKPRRPSAPKTTPQSIEVGCPFCWEWIPAPKRILAVFSGDGCSGGRCPCGAAFVVDETGRSGGQALLDAQALACEGDLDRALKSSAEGLLEVKTRDVDARASVGARGGLGFGLARAKVWFVKPREDPGEPQAE